MKKLFLCVLALTVCASAAERSLEERVDGLQAQIENVVSKAGISFGGEFRSQFLSSTVDGDAVRDDAKKREGVEYTSVDFDIVARPNTALSARAMFRLHQDWRNFFSDIQNPITSRWISIDGKLMSGIISYSLGDYRKKLTPLTLWAPEIDLMYEPEIFAQNRRLAMSEMFLGDNERVLQGASLGFKAELYPILHDVEVDLFGARIATAGTGESVITAPGTSAAPAPYDRYLVGANLATQVIKGAGAGVSYIHIFDALSSFSGDSVVAKVGVPLANISGATSTSVIAGRLNADNRAFMDDDFINFGINAEVALSNDKWYLRSESDPLKAIDTTVSGMALNAGLTARVTLSEGNEINLSASFINNERDFRNDAAQSPTFFQSTVMNNENALNNNGANPLSLGVMNPFDAMYRSVFKYAPSQYYAHGVTPYIKNSYNNSILKPTEVGRTAAREDVVPSVFQAALPGGMASSDRTGPVVNLSGSFLDKGVTVGAKIAMLKTVEEYAGVNHEFNEMIFGAGFDIAKFVPVVGPSLKIGGSYGIYEQKLSNDVEVTSNLMSAELNYQFHQRFALLFGYQGLTSSIPGEAFVAQTKNDQGIWTNNLTLGDNAVASYDYTFSNMAFGVQYKVADGGVLTFKVTMLSGERTSTSGTRYEVDEVDGTTNPVNFSDATSYKALQPEVFLTVKF